MNQQLSFLGIFSYRDDVIDCLQAIKEAGLNIQTVFSPTPCPEINEVLGLKPSPVRFFTLLGGITGLVVGLGLAAFTALKWNIIVGGRPILAWAPFVVIGFECTILFGILATVAGLLLFSRLPGSRIPAYYDPRFTEDKYGIVVDCSKNRSKEVCTLLKQTGAEEVHEIRP